MGKDRIQKIILFLFFAAFCLILFSNSFVPVTGTDVFRHIQLGKIISVQKTVHLREPFLFTFPNSHLFNPNWLFQLFIYFIYNKGGFLGLSFLLVFFSFWTFYFFFRNIGRVSLPAVISAAFIIPFYATRLLVRPHIVSYIFFLVYVYILWRRGLKSIRDFLVLLILQIVWANTHIYFFLGPLLVFLYLGEKVLLKEVSAKKTFITFFFFLLLSLVSLLNPYGLQIYRVVVDSFLGFFHKSSYIFSFPIIELEPVWMVRYRNIFFILLSAAVLILFLTVVCRCSKHFIFVFLFFLFFSLYSSRMAMFFILLSPIYILDNIDCIFKRTGLNFLKKQQVDLHSFIPLEKSAGGRLMPPPAQPARFVRKYLSNREPPVFAAFLKNRLLKVCFYVCLFAAFIFWQRYSFLHLYRVLTGKNKVFLLRLTKHLNRYLSDVSEITPGTINYLNTHRIPVRMFNTYNNGTVLNFYTNRKVFIDSRGGSPDFSSDYLKLYYSYSTPQVEFSKLIDKYGLEAFLTSIVNGDSSVRHLFLDGRFELVYLDRNTVIFVRKDKMTKDLYVDWDKWVEDRIKELERTPKNKLDYYTVIFYPRAARIFTLTGKYDLAKRLYKACIKDIAPNDSAEYYNLGLIYLKEKNYPLAYSYLQKSYKIVPDNAATIVCLLEAARHLGKKNVESILIRRVKRDIPDRMLKTAVKELKFAVGIDLFWIERLKEGS